MCLGQSGWEALLQDLYRRGLEGRALGLIVTDGCAGLAAAIAPSIRGCAINAAGCTRCAILGNARKRDYDEVKAGAQAIYQAESSARPKPLSAVSGRWRQLPALVKGWKETCPSCCRSSSSHVTLEKAAHHQRH